MFMADQVPLKFLPLPPHEFDGLPVGFEYEHEISEDSNTTAFETGVDCRDHRHCVVCGRRVAGGPHPGITRVHIIGRMEDITVRHCFLFELNDSQFHVVGLPEDERLCSFFR
jgi:hypothetical protein